MDRRADNGLLRCGAVIACVLAAFLSYPPLAQAQTTPAQLIRAVNARRVALKLPVLRPASTAAVEVTAVAGAQTTEVRPMRDDPNIWCDVCDSIVWQGIPVEPQALYASLGGTRGFALGMVSARASLAESLQLATDLEAAVFDPRARGITAVPVHGTLVVGVEIDPSAPFTRPLLIDAADPEFGFSLLLPSADTSKRPRVRLFERRGRHLVPLRAGYDRDSGTFGARLLLMGLTIDGLRLAYDRDYLLLVDSKRIGFHSLPLPARGRRAGWTFERLAPRARRLAFRAAFAGTVPLYRRLTDQLDGYVWVGFAGCASVCATVDGLDALLNLSPALLAPQTRRPAVARGIGLLVNQLALDRDGRKAFIDLFSRSPLWLPERRRAFADVFSEQFALWATAAGGPRLAPTRSFAQLLREQFSFRPLVVTATVTIGIGG